MSSSPLLGAFLKTGLCSLSTHTAAEFDLLSLVPDTVVSSQSAIVNPFLFQHVIYVFFLPSPCLFIVQSCSCIEVVGNCFTICLCVKGGSNAEFSVHLEAQHLEAQFCHLLIRPLLVFSHPGILHLSSPGYCASSLGFCKLASSLPLTPWPFFDVFSNHHTSFINISFYHRLQELLSAKTYTNNSELSVCVFPVYPLDETWIFISYFYSYFTLAPGQWVF